eukprot:m.25032 g.25032  ORF g.25032 m.25032 type:complete len:390 (+) comp7667_c0_seq2:126-1295(+)
MDSSKTSKPLSWGVRRVQGILTVFAALAILDIIVDWNIALNYFKLGTPFLWAFCLQVGLVVGTGAIEARYMQPKSTLRYVGALFRLTVFPDTCALISKPTYSTVHPFFASPIPLLVQSVLKSIPCVMLQVYVRHLTTDVDAISSSEELVLPLKTAATIGYAITSYEIEDFKNRQVTVLTPVASKAFFALLLFRMSEISSRFLILIALGPWEPLLAICLLLNPFLIGTILWRLYTRNFRERLPYWDVLCSLFVFVDSRTQNGVCVMDPRIYFTIRFAEFGTLVSYVSYSMYPVPTQHMQLLTSCFFLQLVLLSYVSRRHWGADVLSKAPNLFSSPNHKKSRNLPLLKSVQPPIKGLKRKLDIDSPRTRMRKTNLQQELRQRIQRSATQLE